MISCKVKSPDTQNPIPKSLLILEKAGKDEEGDKTASPKKAKGEEAPANLNNPGTPTT